MGEEASRVSGDAPRTLGPCLAARCTAPLATEAHSLAPRLQKKMEENGVDIPHVFPVEYKSSDVVEGIKVR